MAALILPSRRVVQPQQGYTLNQTAVKETGTFFLTFPDKTLRDAVSGSTLANPGGISFGEKGQTATFNGSQQGNLLFPIPNGNTNLIVAARIRATATQAGTPGAAFGVYQSTSQGGFGVGFDTSNRVGLALLTNTGAYLPTYSAGVQQRWYTVYAQISAGSNGSGVIYVDGRPATTGQGGGYVGDPRTPDEIAIGAQHRSSGYLRQFRGDIEWASLMYVPGETWQSLTDDVALRLYESGYPYNLITPTQRRIIVDLGAGGLSQLQRTTNVSFNTLGFISNDLSNSFSVRGNLTDIFEGTYNIRSLLESDTEFSYTTRGLANSSRDLSYLLRTKVTDDNTVNYNLRSAVTDTSLLNYNLRSSLIDSSAFNYNVRSTVTSNESVEYRLRTLVSVDTVLNYNILSAGQVITNAVISYKVRSNEDSSSSISWHIRSIETKDNYLVYTVRGRLEGSEELTYKVYGTASSNLSLDSNVRGLLAKVTNLSYNVLGLTQVKKDYFLLYNIISSLPPDWTDVYVKQESIFDVRIEPSNAIDIYVKGQDEFIVFIK